MVNRNRIGAQWMRNLANFIAAPYREAAWERAAGYYDVSEHAGMVVVKSRKWGRRGRRKPAAGMVSMMTRLRRPQAGHVFGDKRRSVSSVGIVGSSVEAVEEVARPSKDRQ